MLGKALDENVPNTETFAEYEKANDGKSLRTMNQDELEHLWYVVYNELEKPNPHGGEGYMMKWLASVEHFMDEKER